MICTTISTIPYLGALHVGSIVLVPLCLDSAASHHHHYRRPPHPSGICPYFTLPCPFKQQFNSIYPLTLSRKQAEKKHNNLQKPIHPIQPITMPHATSQVVNGDTSGLKTVSHLKSYPVVSDSIETFKSNPYGKKSLEIVDSAYARLGKPVEPYLKTPYSYAEPIINKADAVGDRVLQHVDGHLPIVKEKTDTIIEKAKSTAFWPYSYLSKSWNDEYSKTANHNNRGPGITTTALSIVSLELRVASDFFHYVADTLRPAYEEGKSKADEYTKSAQKTLGEYESYGKEKLGQLQGEASKKTDDLKAGAQSVKGDAEKKADEAKGSAQKTKDDAQKKLQK